MGGEGFNFFFKKTKEKNTYPNRARSRGRVVGVDH